MAPTACRSSGALRLASTSNHRRLSLMEGLFSHPRRVTSPLQLLPSRGHLCWQPRRVGHHRTAGCRRPARPADARCQQLCRACLKSLRVHSTLEGQVFQAGAILRNSLRTTDLTGNPKQLIGRSRPLIAVSLRGATIAASMRAV
uniref:Uncharacterized protein n=1 Tax=Alexandrium monilatum TaxID=311494 RepID=A0A7S4PSH3_9DINO